MGVVAKPGIDRVLGDAPGRSYASKLECFARFAAPELGAIVDEIGVSGTDVVLDLGCGEGTTTSLLADRADLVVGLDLSLPHLRDARRRHALRCVQGDADAPCLRGGTVDLIFACNTVNHLNSPRESLGRLKDVLRASGRIVLVQSGFLPEMFFAWDAHLDDAVRRACHRYYRERYGLASKDTAPLRGLVGLLRAAGFGAIAARTCVIERVQPLTATDRAYFGETVFERTWGRRLHRFLDPSARRRLAENCDPASDHYCLDRDDFHHLQTLTVCTGERPR